jgi:probable HAF family extracellular repeat protein
MVDLGCIPGGVGDLVQANGVNNAGQVVGFSDFGGGLDVHAFLYSGGQMQDLGNLGGTGLNDNSYAYGINNLGQAVGQGTTANGATHAFLYSGGKMQDLGAFGGASSIAYGINDSGEIIGQCNAPSGGFAFLYSGGEVKELPFEPLAINNAGQVVGYGGTGNGASLYSGGTTLDLNTLIDPSSGWKLVKATAINDVGQIVGDGINPGGQQEAFLLSLLGDFNHDGVVNAADLDQLYVNFTAKVGTYNSLYDANGDGVVNQADVDYILQNVLHCAYGDADLNGAVDFVDFQTLLSHWEKTGAGWAGGDCNGDGVVDFLDFQNLLNYWSPGGSNFAFSEAPEPATLTLILLGGMALLRRSRK